MSNDHDSSLPGAGNALAGLMSDDLIIADDAAHGDDGQEALASPPRAGAEHDGDDDHGDEDAHVEAPTARQDDEDGEPGDEEGDDEDEDNDDEPGDETFTVKVDGEELQVSRQELVNGYQRQADYSRKTQALAEERKAVEAERGQYAGLLGALHDRLQDLPGLDALAAQGHPEAVAMVNQRAAAAAELDRIDAEERQQQVIAGQRQLLDWMPQWRDDTTRQRDMNAVISYARSIGYTPAELQNASDPRAILAMWKAAQYDRLQADAANVQQKATKKGQRVLKAGGSQSTPAAQKSRSERNAMQRLQKSGSLSDAAGILANFVE